MVMATAYSIQRRSRKATPASRKNPTTSAGFIPPPKRLAMRMASST